MLRHPPPSLPFTVDLARELLAHCKAHGLRLRVDAEKIYIHDPDRDVWKRYTVRQALDLLAGKDVYKNPVAPPDTPQRQKRNRGGQPRLHQHKPPKAWELRRSEYLRETGRLG